MGPDKYGGGDEETLPQPLQGGPLEARRCGVALEPLQAVVRGQDEVEEGEVGREVAEFADDELGLRAVAVEPPECERLQDRFVTKA
jgi:hypothetical protein